MREPNAASSPAGPSAGASPEPLGSVRAALGEGLPDGHGDDDAVRRQWWGALATLQQDLLAEGEPVRGLWLASPLPALYEPRLLQGLRGWVWAPPQIESLLAPRPLLPGREGSPETAAGHRFRRLALREEDGTDPLLLLITPRLQVGLAIEGAAGARRLIARFDAPGLSTALQLLDRRLQAESPAAAQELRRSLERLGPLDNDPDLALRFWPRLAERLAAMAPSVTLQPMVRAPTGPARAAAATVNDGGAGQQAALAELALLEALTHEVRTPLATIRTLIRSLLRRGDLPAVVRQRLEQIDSECSEQIDRFGLIFLAAELQRQPAGSQTPGAGELARTDLSQLLVQLEPIWQRQLARRDLRLSLRIEPELPPVLSDPTRLETMLGGLIDRFGRSLPAGSQLGLTLRPAGSRLKLQLSGREAGSGDADGEREGSVASQRSGLLGPVLSWNPATGSLQLSRRATQQLFRRLGGRLTERGGGGSLTVFFPVAGGEQRP